MRVPESSEAGGGRRRAFELITIGRTAFCEGQNVHSIVIVAPLHVSKSFRALKKLIADFPVDSVFFRNAEPNTFCATTSESDCRRRERSFIDRQSQFFLCHHPRLRLEGGSEQSRGVTDPNCDGRSESPFKRSLSLLSFRAGVKT
jgi:hypothetical protein